MPMGCYNKRPEETSDDFFVRIGNAVLARELTWDGAAKVLNGELGKNFGECAYRKRFKAFRAGMQYQESLSNRDVGPAFCLFPTYIFHSRSPLRLLVSTLERLISFR